MRGRPREKTRRRNPGSARGFGIIIFGMEKDRLQPDEFRVVRLALGAARARFPRLRSSEVSQPAETARRLLEMHVNAAILDFGAGAGERSRFAELAAALREYGVLPIASVFACERVGGRGAPIAPGGRRAACLNDEEWIASVDSLVKAAAESGAGGVVFENFGFHAACACGACRSKLGEFAASRGVKAPGPSPAARMDSPEGRLRAEWRAGVATARLEGWAAAFRGLVPDAIVAVHIQKPMERNVYSESGVDLRAVMKIADLLIAENNNMTRLNKRGLTYDATTFYALEAVCGGAALCNLPRFRGAGFDQPFQPWRFQAALAEAAACGGLPHAQGAEFLRDGVWASLVDDGFEEHRAEIGRYMDWLEKNAEIFDGAERREPVNVLYPEAAMRERRTETAPAYFQTVQILTELHILHGVVTAAGAAVCGDGLLIVPSVAVEEAAALRERLAAGGRTMFLGAAPEWAAGKPGVWSVPAGVFDAGGRFPGAAALGGAFEALYMRSALVRNLADRAHLHEAAEIARGRYVVPKRWNELYDTAMEAARELPPDTVIEGPPSIHVHRRRRGGAEYYHIVNLLPGAERMSGVSLKFARPCRVRILSPDDAKIRYSHEQHIIERIRVYTVVEAKE